jgi:prepilin peptidase CpaA
MVINLALGGLLLVCGFTDLIKGKIYNRVTLPFLLIGPLLHLFFGGIEAGGESILGLVVGFFLFLPVFLFKGMGGGDVKLMAVVGGLVGYPLVLWSAFCSVMVGGVMAFLFMIRKGRLFRGLKNVGRTVFSFILSRFIKGRVTVPLTPTESQRIPFGLAICIGTLFSLWWGIPNLNLFF